MKNSKLNVILTLIGVLFVIGSIVGGFFAFIAYIKHSMIGLFDLDEEYLFDDTELSPDDITIADTSEI